MTSILTAAFYKFVALPDFKALRQPLLDFCERHGVKGTILLAEEGVNGTIAGAPDAVRAVLDYLRRDPRLADLEHKESYAKEMPFYRMKVRLKKEIVSLGVPGVSPVKQVGKYVTPEQWNRLLDDPSVVVIDTRNDYEVRIGTFKGAIDPKTKSFTELPAWVRAQSALQKKPRVAMFCTGGIRCEKSTSFMLAEGFAEVYHLQGGILKYLETVPPEQSRWQGECFVFDERVSVGHGLRPGNYELCRSCREPVGDAERASPHFERGISCPRCHGTRSAVEIANLRERQRQVNLAKQRNDAHIGVRLEEKREQKRRRRAALQRQRARAGEASLPLRDGIDELDGPSQ